MCRKVNTLLSVLLILVLVIGQLPGVGLTVNAEENSDTLEWHENDVINLKGKYFRYNGDSSALSIDKDNTVPSPEYSGDLNSWVFPGCVYSSDVGEEERLPIIIQRPDDRSADFPPTGFKVAGGNGSEEDPYCFELVYTEEAPAAVETTTLSEDSAALAVGETKALTAEVLPENAADKTVRWSVAGTAADTVKLYTDEDCTIEAGTEVTDALTVYAKGLSAGEATVTVMSSFDETVSSSCNLTVSNLWVGETAVTPGKTSGDGWIYNPDTNTLTLSGANISSGHTVGEYTYGIYYTGSDLFTIELAEGSDNHIESGNYPYTYGIRSADTNASVTVSGAGSLTVSGSENGISVNGNLTVSGTSDVDARGNLAGLGSDSSDAVISVTGGTVNAEGRSDTGIGISFPGGVTISAGTVSAAGGGGAVSGGVRNAIPGSGWFDISGEGEGNPIEVTEGEQSLAAYKRVFFGSVSEPEAERRADLFSATPVTREEAEARNGNLSEEERIVTLDSIFGEKPTISLGDGTSVQISDNVRKILISEAHVTYTHPDGVRKQDIPLNLTGSYMKVADDVVLIQETRDNWFTGSSNLNIGGEDSVIIGTVPLKEGVPVLILETNGDLHAFYAGSGTNSTMFVPGQPVNVYRGITGGHIVTMSFDPQYPLLPVIDSWSSGKLTSGPGTIIFHVDFDFDLYLYLFPELNIRDNSVEVIYDSLEIELYGDYVSSKEISLGDVSGDLCDVFAIDGGCSFSIEGTGKGTTEFSASVREGFYFSMSLDYWVLTINDCGWHHTTPTFEILSSDMVGECYFGLSWGVKAIIGKIIGLGPSYKIGIVVEGEKSKDHKCPGDTVGVMWHACEDDECLCGNAHTRTGPLSLSLGIDPLGIYTSLLDMTDPEDDPPFVYFYDSKTFGDKSMSSPCPHIGYLLNATVVNEDGVPIPGATVTYERVPAHYESVASAVTGADGKAVLHVPTGDYRVTAALSSLEAFQELKKTADSQDVTLTLDTPTNYVHFEKNTASEPTDWPQDIAFIPSISSEVTLPDTIPELSGYQFTGWNTKADGSGNAYAPGTKLTLNNNLTLYAQWEKAEESWYVIYNANGGTYAPGPQIISHGTDAVLSSNKPVHGKMTFEGWTPDPRSKTLVYQPGDTLRYDSKKNVVVLYAIWYLDPVEKPIHISFNANKVEDAQLPSDVWLELGSWLRLSEASAPFGSSFVFQGWSENPDAKSPDYRAGTAYYFDRNTTLYAIWEDLDAVTLTFLDPLPDSSSNIPDPIHVVSSMSRTVKIPEQIPKKPGRIFIGWNTEKDGSGTSYAPGNLLTLTQDLTLWAQWRVAGDDWYLIYIANNATWTPGTDIIPRGRDAVINSQPPKSDTLIFKGWTSDPQTNTPVYQPGDTLPYTSGKNYVILYAMWELSPVERPVIITFDANGGRKDTLPDSVSAPKKTQFLLPEKTPSWDPQHDFVGWALSPKAAKAEWKAKDQVAFEEDTTLYAIWNAHYRVISGAGSVWTRHSTAVQRFIADGDIAYFSELRIDGKRFMDGVEFSSGSTVADIHPWAMETLSSGTHTITFVYVDGEASAEFTVQASVPDTRDIFKPALWQCIFILNLVVLAVTAGALLYIENNDA